MTPIKRHCQFLVDKEKGKEDGRLRYRIKWNREIVAFNVGYRVYLSKWSKETQRCVQNTTHGRDKISASEINRAIQIMEDDISSIFYKYEMNDIMPTKENIREDYNLIARDINLKENIVKLVDLFQTFINDQSKSNHWSASTIKKMTTILKHLTRYKADANLDEITETYLQGFIDYLLYNRKMRNTTIEKNYRLLMWFLRWATKHEYITTKAHILFEPKFKNSTKEVIFLDWNELIALYNYDFKQRKYLERVRDVFCFCSFTGLRYSDVANLSRADVHDDHIEIVTQKTDDRLIIELNKYSKELLDKYKDIPIEENKALPIISMQKMNEYLKKIGKMLNFNEPIKDTYYKGNRRFETTNPKWELLSTHCARRTFVVNAISLGVPTHVIMKWTGHKSMESMKPYTKIVDKLKRTEMDKFNR
ncbi:site-specific integrase [Bacteroides coprosuis]|uniref:site-specific integrase n=1 Tax=Bacteroides coprosuis TaxID=151276 RepID=UPI001E1084A7|nr:site-specific integrase [Bacteroides coprosuis]HJD92924.1 site-specific integrase [Bacteroides coprosuis]